MSTNEIAAAAADQNPTTLVVENEIEATTSTSLSETAASASISGTETGATSLVENGTAGISSVETESTASSSNSGTNEATGSSSSTDQNTSSDPATNDATSSSSSSSSSSTTNEPTPTHTTSVTNQELPTTSIANEDIALPPAEDAYDGIASSSSVINGAVFVENDTPTSSEPSTPTMTEITIPEEEESGATAVVAEEATRLMADETLVAVPNEAVTVVAEENAVAVAEEAVAPVENENAAVVAEGTAEPVVNDAPVPVPEETAAVAVEDDGALVAEAAEPVANDAPVAVEGNETLAAEEGAAPAGDNVAAPVQNDPPVLGENEAPIAGGDEAPAPAQNEAPAAGEDQGQVAGENEAPAAAENDPTAPVQTETPTSSEPTTPEETPAEPVPEPEPEIVYDPTKPTLILDIPPEIVLHMFNFLPLSNMKDFSLCSKRCRSLAIRRIFKHVNISSDAIKAFQKDGDLHHIADAVFGLVIRTRYINRADGLCEFIRDCMHSTEDEGLGVFKAVRRVKLSYGQVPYDRKSAIVKTGPLDSLSELDARLIRAMFLSLRRVGFWKRIRWLDFVVKLWEDRHGVFEREEEEGEQPSPESKYEYLSEEDGKFLEGILEEGIDDEKRDMVAVAPALRDVRLINFKPRRRVTYRRKVDIFEVLAMLGGKPDKVVLEYISAGESIDLVPASKIDQVRVQRGVEDMWVNMASFDVPGFMEEIGTRFVDLKSLLVVVTAAGGEGYLLPAKGAAAPWRRGVLEKMEMIEKLNTVMLPVRVGQEGENISHGRRKELGEVPKDTVERLAELVIYFLENGREGLEKVIFERKELEDDVDSAVGPGWVCRIKWENKRPKLDWTVENCSVLA
ncbi:hypothetical protein TWF281_009002 [Arthrobotrys megalospora]